MIDVVFSDSACGGLKAAQSYGEGEFKSSIGSDSGLIAVSEGETIRFEWPASQEDDHSQWGNLTDSEKEEVQKAVRQMHERERLEWEKATPMGGDPDDVFGFHLVLSVGDISEDIPAEKRGKVLEWLYSVYPELEEEGETDFAEELVRLAEPALKEICARISSGDSVRIWYSNNPDEICGMHWFMAQINTLGLKDGQAILVQLPEWEVRDDGPVLTQSDGWGGVSAGKWHSYLDLQKPVITSYCAECAARWEQLKRENSPLRAVVKGQLVSVPEDYYDELIERVIEAEPNEFHEATVIGKILGEYSLGIGDAWIAHRIDSLIDSGKLIPVTEPAKGRPSYHRNLKKCGI